MTNVDQYRKNLGKHDRHQSKKDLRKIKDDANKRKESNGLKEGLIILGICILLLLLVYFLFFINFGERQQTISRMRQDLI